MFEELEEKEKNSKVWPTITGIIATIAIAAGWFFYEKLIEKKVELDMEKITIQVEQDMKNIAIQVALEEERKFKLVNENGSNMEMCIHAGTVAAAWLQTENSERYKQWKEIQKKMCKAAGLR